MLKYGEKSRVVEWSRFLVYRLGNIIGFAEPSKACVIASIVWLLSWIVMPGSHTMLYEMPLLAKALVDIGLTLERGVWISRGAVILGTLAGLLCWARVAVLLMPKTFDRYKITGVPL